METLKEAIKKVLSETSSVDWLIVHDISKANLIIENVEFSFVDGEERRDEPFKTNQGYITLNTPSAIAEFEKIITELSQEFQSNHIALANLFIIATRTSYKTGGEITIAEKFKNIFEKDTCQSVFNLLIISLNSEYYKYNRSSNPKPANTNEWLDLFHSTMHGFSDPIISSLQLVRDERNLELDFNLMENMQPLLRAVLMGWYGFDLKISTENLKRLYNKEQELSFLSAVLIDDTGPDKTPPDWLNADLVELFIDKHWKNIGNNIFIHVFGLSYRNKNNNELYKKLEDLIHALLFKKLSSEMPAAIEWIYELKFPNDFIALFSWFSIKKISPNSIPSLNNAAIFNKFINEMQRISKELPEYLASQNSSDPFTSFQMHEWKYRNIFPYLLLLSLNATKDNFKAFESICYGFKPLFYGGFRSCQLAKHFTELMLLIYLSGNNINGMEEKDFHSLKPFLEIIAKTILVPYVHLAERDDQIWNPESEKQTFDFDAGGYLVTTALSNIRNHGIYPHYEDFFNQIDVVKIAKWNYEAI